MSPSINGRGSALIPGEYRKQGLDALRIRSSTRQTGTPGVDTPGLPIEQHGLTVLLLYWGSHVMSYLDVNAHHYEGLMWRRTYTNCTYQLTVYSSQSGRYVERFPKAGVATSLEADAQAICTWLSDTNAESITGRDGRPLYRRDWTKGRFSNEVSPAFIASIIQS